jgi:two-component SAPR family response regulator
VQGLQILTLGESKTLLDGQNITWVSVSAENLLHYLLAYPKGKLYREILEDLWQTDHNEQSSGRFRVTVHRLRKAIGNMHAVQDCCGRFFLSEDVLQASDLYQLRISLKEAEQTSNEQKRIKAYKRVYSIYQGDFLPDCEEEWARQIREEYKNSYLQTCLEISSIYCSQHECRLAVQVLAHALKADPYIGENYHQHLMGCLSTVEGKYTAIEYYRRFVHFLKVELNDTPMPETIEFAERIKLGEHICPRLEGKGLHKSAYYCPFINTCSLHK